MIYMACSMTCMLRYIAANKRTYHHKCAYAPMQSKEHSIQYIKPELKFLRKTVKYLQQKLINIRKKGTFKWLSEQFGRELDEGNYQHIDFDDNDDGDKDETCGDDNVKCNDDTSDDDTDDDDDDGGGNLGAQQKSNWFSSYHRYENVEEIDERLQNGKALCGFLHENDQGVVRVAFGRGRSKVDFVKIKICPTMHEELCGLHYFRFERQSTDDSESNNATTKEIIRKKAAGFCILLPFVENGCTTNQKYSLVTDDWTTLDEYGKICLPSLSKNLFAEYFSS